MQRQTRARVCLAVLATSAIVLSIVGILVHLNGRIQTQSEHQASGFAATVLVTKSLPDGYICGAIVLARSFRQFLQHKLIDLVAMVAPSVDSKTRELLLAEGFTRIVEVQQIPHPSKGKGMLAERFLDTFTKLRAWQLTSYEKVLLLDADTLVNKPLLSLFSDTRLNHDEIAAVVDCCDMFNSGVLLLRPSESLFQSMMGALPDTPSYDGGDQGFLNAFFENSWLRLPYRYNSVQTTIQSGAWDPQTAAILHFMEFKPWRQLSADQAFLSSLHDIWWDLTTGQDDIVEQICS